MESGGGQYRPTAASGGLMLTLFLFVLVGGIILGLLQGDCCC
jgi:hypothetical protein